MEAASSTWNEAIRRMENRIKTTASGRPAGFPHFADSESGAWTTTPDGDWTGGFWCGLLWLAHHHSKAEEYKTWASSWTERLMRRTESRTIFRCFLFYYGAVIGEVLTQDDLARRVGLLGATGLAKLYNSKARLIPLGEEAEEASRIGRSETNIDGVMAIALLTWAADLSGDENLRQIGIEHARAHMALCIREDGSVCQSAAFNPRSGELVSRYTHKGYSDGSTWARAQAWAMLGYALAAKCSPRDTTFLRTAERVADWWIDHLPGDNVAFWDFDDPHIPNVERDTSATSIAAASLIKLGALTDDREKKKRYREAAEKQVRTLVKSYLTPTSEHDRRPVGILTEGCYNKKIRLATCNELIWGDYFLLESLCVLSGNIGPAVI